MSSKSPISPMPSHEKKPVVIVGAGPCGLAAACELLQLGVSVRVLEAAPDRPRGSRSIQLWPPALEVLDRIGVLAEARRRGLGIKTNRYHLADGRQLRITLGEENEPLILPQEQTNQLLEEALERLGGSVERSTKVVHVDATPGLVTVKVHGPGGVELIEADWLIGADGVRSEVRRQLGIDFPGEPVPITFLLAEGRVDGDYDRTSAHYFLGRTGSVVFMPMPGETARVAAAVDSDTALTPETVQELLDERGPGGMRLTRLDTITTFGSQERIATALRQGRCFLVGDAAHTHSPVGGQGLNLGLQDVHNLVWKLAGVIDGRLDTGILDTYDTERRQAAGQTVRTTHQLVRILTVGPVVARIRNAVCDVLEATGVLRRRFIPRLAGWRTRYPDAFFGTVAAEPRSRPRPIGARYLPEPGARTPHWVPAPMERTGHGFRLLTTGPSSGPLARGGEAVAERWPRLLSHEHLPRGRAGFLVLRPDGFVAASGRSAAGLTRLDRSLMPRLSVGGSSAHDRV